MGIKKIRLVIRYPKGWLRKALPSIVVAFYIMIPTISLMLTRINPAFGSVMTPLYTLGALLAAVVILLGRKPKPTNSFVVVFLSIIIAYVLSPDYGELIQLTTPYFVMFTLVPFMIPQFLKVNTRLVTIFAMAFSSFGVLFPRSLFLLTSENVISIDLTYSLLFPVVAMVVYLGLYWKTDDWRHRLMVMPFILANSVYLFYVAFFGSRAPLMSIILCILFLYVCHASKRRRGVRVNRRRLVRVLLALVAVVVFFMVIVSALDAFLAKYGLDSGMLAKLSRLQGEGDLTNGRSYIVAQTLSAFMDSPIFGYGFSASPYIIDDDYPHNFILQFLLDGGTVLFLIAIVPMVYHMKMWWERCTFNEFALITLFFFAAVIGALFSLDLWMNARLWFFFGYLFSKVMSYNRGHKRKRVVKYVTT